MSNGDITEFSHGDDNVVCRFKDTEVGFKLWCGYGSDYYNLYAYIGFFSSQNQFLTGTSVSANDQFRVNTVLNVFYSNIDDAIISFSLHASTSQNAVNLVYQRCSIENHNYVFAYITGSGSSYWSDRGKIVGLQYIYSVSDEVIATKQVNTTYYGDIGMYDPIKYAASVKNSCYFSPKYNYATISQSNFQDIVSGKINYVNNTNKKLYILGDANSYQKTVEQGVTYLVNGTPLIATSKELYAFF